MPNPRGKTAPPPPRLGGKRASMPSSNTHSSGGAPQQIKAGVNKGRTNTYEAPKAGRRRGSQS
jgi:hypothetical protein